MADTVKVLGQLAPAAAVLTAAYTVPSGKTATVSSVSVCNTGAGTSYLRISIQVAGAADSLKQYIYYDLPIMTNDTFIATCGFTLGSGDVVAVRSSDGNLSFNIFGIEMTS